MAEESSHGTDELMMRWNTFLDENMDGNASNPAANFHSNSNNKPATSPSRKGAREKASLQSNNNSNAAPRTSTAASVQRRTDEKRLIAPTIPLSLAESDVYYQDEGLTRVYAEKDPLPNRTTAALPPPPPPTSSPPTTMATTTTTSTSTVSTVAQEASETRRQPGAFAIQGIGGDQSDDDESDDDSDELNELEGQTASRQGADAGAGAVVLSATFEPTKEADAAVRKRRTSLRMYWVVLVIVAAVTAAVVVYFVVSNANSSSATKTQANSKNLGDDDNNKTDVPAPTPSPTMSSAPTAKSRNSTRLVDDSDYATLLFVQWGYYFGNCSGGWKNPLTIEIGCEGDFVRAWDIRSLSNNASFKFSCDYRTSRGIGEQVCTLEEPPETVSHADFIFMMGCGVSDPALSVYSIVNVPTLSGYSCSLENPSGGLVGEVSTGVSVAQACFPEGTSQAGELRQPTIHCQDPNDLTTLDGTSVQTCSRLVSCEGDCSPETEDMGMYIDNVGDDCFLRPSDKNAAGRFEWDKEAMWEAVEKELALPDFSRVNHVQFSSAETVP